MLSRPVELVEQHPRVGQKKHIGVDVRRPPGRRIAIEDGLSRERSQRPAVFRPRTSGLHYQQLGRFQRAQGNDSEIGQSQLREMFFHRVVDRHHPQAERPAFATSDS